MSRFQAWYTAAESLRRSVESDTDSADDAHCALHRVQKTVIMLSLKMKHQNLKIMSLNKNPVQILMSTRMVMSRAMSPNMMEKWVHLVDNRLE